MQDTRERLESILRQRIAVLDGSWGVLLQREVRGEEGYRGEWFRDHGHDVAGDPDLLNLTQPDRSPASTASTSPPAPTSRRRTRSPRRTIGQADYGLEGVVEEMNLEARGSRARRRTSGKPRPGSPRFVAGSVGPLNVSLSLSPRSTTRPTAPRRSTRSRRRTRHQIGALREGGVDLLLIETVFDTLNAKAAIVAALDVAPELPLWLSFTAVDKSGRNLSGQTVEAFWISVEHAAPLVVGVNCSLGATEMRPFVEDLAQLAPTWVACYPNAGLPNELGLHDEQPDDTSRFLGEFARDGLVNIVGGCCGTTPEHVRQIAAAVEGVAAARLPSRAPRRASAASSCSRSARTPTSSLIGERTNITGSARFRRLVESGDFQAALDVALEQVRGGANLLDVNMDADLLDGERAMTTFLNLVATEPEVARLPIMVDSSRWSVLEAGLKCVQGKGVVNSLCSRRGRSRSSSRRARCAATAPASS